MGIKFGSEPCERSKNERGCIFKHSSANPIGDGEVKHIWSCRRCGKKTIETIQQGVVECATSKSYKHQWEDTQQISFQQHYKYRDIKVIQSCSCCGAMREYQYQSMIGYQPKR